MTQKSPYHSASPLKADRKEIRVLELLPIAGDSGFEASCLVHAVSLLQAQKLHYSALSYVWGVRTATKPILLNGRTHKVTQNLAAALKFFTAFRQNRLDDFRLWADAVCINQITDPDNHEKDEQVEMMGDIFASAGEVLSWLGYNPSIPKYVHTFVRLHKESINAGSNPEPRKSHWLKAYPELYAEDAPGNEKWLVTRQSWASIRDFVELSYWSRMWIFQELILAMPGKLFFFTPAKPYFINGDDLRRTLEIIETIGRHFHQQIEPDYITQDMLEHFTPLSDLGSACKLINRLLVIRRHLHEK